MEGPTVNHRIDPNTPALVIEANLPPTVARLERPATDQRPYTIIVVPVAAQGVQL